MLRSFLQSALRNIRRNKMHSIINVAGLALGMAAFLLILEYVSFERSVNGFHQNLPSLFRLLNEDKQGVTWGEVEPGWAKRATENFPEIVDYCRFENGAGKGVVRREEKGGEPFREENIGYADGNFFRLFSFPLLQGRPEAFDQPNVVFLSESAVEKYFGKEDPMGQTLSLYNQFGKGVFTVTGVFNSPENSDIRYEMVFSLQTLANPGALNGNSWAELDNLNSQYVNTFFLLRPGTDYKKLEQKLARFRDRLKTDKDGVTFRLQPFSELHLPSSLGNTYQTLGNLKYIYILSVIALLILAIAWFNYINLSTAQALKRAREVGVRKAMGASRSVLVLQFLGESALFTFLSFVLAILLVYASQPFFNGLVGKELSLRILLQPAAWGWGGALLLLGSLLSGGYTAFCLSRFQPVQILKSSFVRSNEGGWLRKTLVVAQFCISITILLATVFIYRQLKYMQSQNLGMKPEQLLVVRGPNVEKDSTFSSRKTSFLAALQQQSFVQAYAQSGTVPGNFFNFMTSGFTHAGSVKGDEYKPYAFALVDNRYFDTYGIPLKAGRNFTEPETAVEWNENNKILLNESAVKQFGFQSAEEALRNKIQWDERALEVIGVVKNYHHTGLQKNIEPIIFYPQKNSAYFSVRLQTNRLQDNISALEKLYKTWFPNNPFDYFFADENFNKQYLAEQQYSRLFAVASVWAILIACLGLFGLASFSVQQRTKEIGIRKVLGASELRITRMLSHDFLKLVVLAILLATPLAWWAVVRWLQDFAYRIQPEWWVFVLVSLLALLLAFCTVGYQAIKAAVQNPVKWLRNE